MGVPFLAAQAGCSKASGQSAWVCLPHSRQPNEALRGTAWPSVFRFPSFPGKQVRAAGLASCSSAYPTQTSPCGNAVAERGVVRTTARQDWGGVGLRSQALWLEVLIWWHPGSYGAK